jgi:hypothetical protein
MISVYDFHIRACMNKRYLGMVMTGQVVLTRAERAGQENLMDYGKLNLPDLCNPFIYLLVLVLYESAKFIPFRMLQFDDLVYNCGTLMQRYSFLSRMGGARGPRNMQDEPN